MFYCYFYKEAIIGRSLRHFFEEKTYKKGVQKLVAPFGRQHEKKCAQQFVSCLAGSPIAECIQIDGYS